MPRALRPHQQRMVDFIVEHPRCAVWAEPGLGKTATVLTALERLDAVEQVFPALVLAPLRVARSVWPVEPGYWPHLQRLRVQVVCGTPAQRRCALRSEADLYATNYDNVERLIETLDGDWPFRTTIADESTKLKGFRLRQGAKRAQALSSVAHRSARWINLTGTPSPNGLEDLWGQTWFIDQGARLGRSYSAFMARWFTMSRDGFSWAQQRHAQDEIQAKLADVCVSLRAEDHMQLPPLVETTIAVDLPHAARVAYDAVEREMFAELADGGVIEAALAAARTQKCLQIANGAAYLSADGSPSTEYAVLHDEKLIALESLVDELSGAPLLVAYQFKHDLARLKKHFGKRLRSLDSDPKTIDDWNEGRIPVLAVHPASAGHGLSLQHGGHHIAFVGLWWNLEEHLQVIERLGPTRQAQSGYGRKVFVYRIVARGTVDELVLDRLTSKRSVQDVLMHAMKERANGR